MAYVGHVLEIWSTCLGHVLVLFGTSLGPGAIQFSNLDLGSPPTLPTDLRLKCVWLLRSLCTLGVPPTLRAGSRSRWAGPGGRWAGRPPDQVRPGSHTAQPGPADARPSRMFGKWQPPRCNEIWGAARAPAEDPQRSAPRVREHRLLGSSKIG